MSQFGYLLDKIADAPFSEEPFRHLEIEDFLAPEHFEEIVASPQVSLPSASSTEELLQTLEANGYIFLHFPGCVSTLEEYLDFQKGKPRQNWHQATEGYGIVYRLADSRSQIIDDLDSFFRSDELRSLLLDKFGIERKVTVDAGLQKYLDGYEISPHPDIRRKALTWMLNINPGENSEEEEFHTHYMRLKPKWSYIHHFWKHNPEFDRDWLPWDWCDTGKRQRSNNSIVFFQPSDDTIHAVKARYDHLTRQRTQMYGNLWYEKQSLPKARFDDLDVPARILGGQQAKKEPELASKDFVGTALGKIKRKLSKPEVEGFRAVEF